MKRIVTIQDISCIGRCSLTAALPILSVCGIETAVVPTAVLSGHTAFPDFTFRDLTDDILPIAEVWRSQNITFDSIYTGYIGSERQIEIVSDFIDMFRTDKTLVVVDPAMADNGVLYKGFPDAFVSKMKTLCQKADIILPNMTEACLLLGRPYRETASESEVRKILHGLVEETHADAAVLTGVSREAGHLGAASLCKDGSYDYCSGIWYPERFHGTGDMFASVITGALVRGLSLHDALALAVDFTAECARLTLEDPDRRWYGVNFEQALPMLMRRLDP
ncbi:MAG: pyridoxamine kinase [Lachnospiraceae bacterium]|nr:pyridoxamine kinase [Lachnospiraceae bacterium]